MSRSAARRSGILDDDDAPPLPVAAARGEARRVEQALEHVVAHRLGVELACRAGAAQRGDEVEVHEWRSVVAGWVSLGWCHRPGVPARSRRWRGCGGSPPGRWWSRPWRAGRRRSTSSRRRRQRGRWGSWPVATRRRRRWRTRSTPCGPPGSPPSASMCSCRAGRRRTRHECPPTWRPSLPRRPHSVWTRGQPTWEGDDYERKLEVLLGRAPRGRQLHLRPARRRGGAVAAVPGVDRGAHRDHARGGGARAPGGPRRPLPAGRGGGGAPGQPGQRRPSRPGPADPLAPGGGLPPDHRAAHRGRRGGWARGRGRPAGPGCGAGAGRHRLLALPREWRPPAPQGRARRSRLRRDHRHPCLQREAGPGARQHHGARPSRRAGGLPGDQQRHPAAARRGGAGRRCRAHEPLRRHGVPPRRGPARRRRWSSGWCQDCAGEQPARDHDHRVHAPRRGGRGRRPRQAAPRRRRVDEPAPGHRRGHGRHGAAHRDSSRSSATAPRRSPWRPCCPPSRTGATARG